MPTISLLTVQSIDAAHAALFGNAGKMQLIDKRLRRQQFADRRHRAAQTLRILLRGQHRHAQPLRDTDQPHAIGTTRALSCTAGSSRSCISTTSKAEVSSLISIGHSPRSLNPIPLITA